MRVYASATAFLLSILLSPAFAADPSGSEPGWKQLFDGATLNGWHSFKKPSFPDKGWLVEDGWLHCLGKGGGDLLSSGEYDHFELEWDWKLAPHGNSGLKYFVLETRNAALGHEYQMIDDQLTENGAKLDAKQLTASFYDILAPEVKNAAHPIGQVNHSRILVKGDEVEHWLNGIKVLSYTCGSQAVKDGVAHSKFKNTDRFGFCVKGHLLLQDHGSEAWFRNIRIRDLSSK